MNFLGRPGTPLGTLGEPKNSPKIDFLLKNGVPNVLFRRFLWTKLVSTIFARFFVGFSRKIDEKNNAFLRIVACFFQHGDPHETLYFTIRKLLFHFSRFCVFPKKKRRKTCSEIETTFFPQKSPKCVPGNPFWDPKRSRINVGEVKKPKNVGKRSILDTVGF